MLMLSKPLPWAERIKLYERAVEVVRDGQRTGQPGVLDIGFPSYWVADTNKEVTAKLTFTVRTRTS
jgi:hypothetical protein